MTGDNDARKVSSLSLLFETDSKASNSSNN